ncbi:MAG: hypothetical protein V9G24_11890 [Rhodoblastus sp.]
MSSSRETPSPRSAKSSGTIGSVAATTKRKDNSSRLSPRTKDQAGGTGEGPEILLDLSNPAMGKDRRSAGFDGRPILSSAAGVATRRYSETKSVRFT